MTLRTGVLSLLAISTATAQQLSIGFKAGVPVNSNLRHGVDESRRYVFGPMAELQLNRKLAVEFAPQYRRLGTSYAYLIPLSLRPPDPSAPGGAPIGVIVPADQTALAWNRSRGNSWEFPLVGKYYFGDADRKWRPFAGTGWALRKIWVTSEGEFPIYDNLSQYSGRMQKVRNTDASETGTGVVVVLGIKGRLGPVKVAPEIRYTRWSIESPIQPRRDQVDFSVGFTF